MAGYDLLMIFWSGFLIFGLFMAYQDYRKWITSMKPIGAHLGNISIVGQGIVFVGIALADYFLTLNQHLMVPRGGIEYRHKDFQCMTRDKKPLFYVSVVTVHITVHKIN